MPGPSLGAMSSSSVPLAMHWAPPARAPPVRWPLLCALLLLWGWWPAAEAGPGCASSRSREANTILARSSLCVKDRPPFLSHVLRVVDGDVGCPPQSYTIEVADPYYRQDCSFTKDPFAASTLRRYLWTNFRGVRSQARHSPSRCTWQRSKGAIHVTPSCVDGFVGFHGRFLKDKFAANEEVVDSFSPAVGAGIDELLLEEDGWDEDGPPPAVGDPATTSGLTTGPPDPGTSVPRWLEGGGGGVDRRESRPGDGLLLPPGADPPAAPRSASTAQRLVEEGCEEGWCSRTGGWRGWMMREGSNLRLLNHSDHTPAARCRGQCIEADAEYASRWGRWVHEGGFVAPLSVLRRGVVYQGDLGPTDRVLRKLEAGDPITMVVIGTSVSGSHGGCTHGLYHDHRDPKMRKCSLNGRSKHDGYMRTVFDWVNATWPHRGHRLINAAKGGLLPSAISNCVWDYVPTEADLVVLEFAVLSQDAGQVMALERMLRKLLGVSSPPAVIFLNTFLWCNLRVSHGKPPKEPELVARMCKSPTPPGGEPGWANLGYTYVTPTQSHITAGEDHIASLGQYYNAVVLSLRAAVFHAVVSGLPGYADDRAFTWDGVHPNFGGAHFYSQLIVHHLATAMGGLRARAREADAGESLGLPGGARYLPVLPMLPGGLETATVKCYRHMGGINDWEWKQLPFTRRDSCWELVDEGGGGKVKPGVETNTAHCKAELSIDTRGLPGRYADRVIVKFVYLVSYEGMGRMRVSCARHCQCEPVVAEALDVGQRRSVDKGGESMLVTRHSDCRMAIESLRGENGEEKFKLVGVDVEEEPVVTPQHKAAMKGRRLEKRTLV